MQRVTPALEAQDWGAFVQTLNHNWTYPQIRGLLDHPQTDVRKIAALALGLIGKDCCLPDLGLTLRQETDHMICEMAEHAMWQIWFRGGSDAANAHLVHGAAAMNDQQLDVACEHFNAAIGLCPDFAEAYNQRAMARYLAEDYEASIDDCLRTIELMPLHFNAWMGMGHCHAALGQTQEAIEAYEHALKLNPHLDCIAELIDELREGQP